MHAPGNTSKCLPSLRLGRKLQFQSTLCVPAHSLASTLPGPVSKPAQDNTDAAASAPLPTMMVDGTDGKSWAPEPVSIALMAGGLLGFAAVRRFRKPSARRD
jgi:hypothetical protein